MVFTLSGIECSISGLCQSGSSGKSLVTGNDVQVDGRREVREVQRLSAVQVIQFSVVRHQAGTA